MTLLKVGLIGCGHISESHLQAWRKAPGVSVSEVFDLDRALAERRGRSSGAQVATSVETLIEGVDIVDVCTPPQTHAALAEQVLTEGRHLVIEKPLVTSATDWTRLAELASSGPGKIAVIHNLKYSAAVQQALRWAKEGKIGRVLRIQRDFLTDPGTDRMLEAERHWSHALPGGRWFETLPHELYLIHCFSGALELVSVAVCRSEQAPRGAPADEVVVTMAGERALATIHFSAHCRRNRRVLSLQGSEGRIEVDVLADFATLSRRGDGRGMRAIGGPVVDALGTALRAIPDRASYLLRRLRGETPHGALIAAFARHLQGQGPEPTPLSEVDYVVRLGEEIGREIDRQAARA